MNILLIQRTILQFFWDIIYFPIWWYSKGAKKTFLFCIDLVKFGNKYMAPMIWVRNILTPMFGQNDIKGRIVSFIMRVANIIGRFIGLIIWSLFVIFIFLLWVGAPILVLFMLFYSLV